MDERRRRRLAVSGEAGADASDQESRPERSLPACVPSELCAASPWIPFSPWKLWTLAGLLILGLVAVMVVMHHAPSFRPELAPALDPLFRGEQPRLVSYLETIFWTLSGQLALLVGWHRSRSRFDFRGKYRIWPWAAGVMFCGGLCAATNLHVGLGAVIEELGFVEQFRTRIGWRVPALCLMLPLWLVMDRDVRRSRSSVIVLRIALLTLLVGVSAGLYKPAAIDPAIWPVVELAGGLFGSAMLMLAMWVQGWYVAYVTPDPPAPVAVRWPKFNFRIFGFLGWLLSLVFGLFKRRAAAPAPKRRKKAEEAGTTKRKRKTKRTTKRTRTKAVEEAESAEEEEDEADSESDSEEYDEAEEEESYEEEDEDETPPARVTAPAAKPSVTAGAARPQAQPAAKTSNSASNQDSDDDEDEDDDDESGTQWRVDGPSAEQLKGLSKRQRRALIKQHRDQQRNQRNR
jgi:hypothetical protein